MRSLTWLMGPRFSVILGFGATCGALACVALFWLARRFFDSTVAGVVAGVGFALHPAWVVLSLSESPWPFALLLFLLGCLVGDVAAATPGVKHRRRLAWIWGALLALACEVHVSAAVLPVIALAFLWFSSQRGQPGAWRSFVGPFALVVLTSACHAVLVASTAIGGKVADRAEMLRHPAWGTPRDLFAQPDLVPRVLLPLFVIGSLLLWHRYARLVLASWLGVVLILVSGFTVLACRTDAIRYQAPAHVFAYLMLAGLVAWMPSRAWAAGIITAAMAPDLWTGLRDVRVASVHAAAFDQLRHEVDELPQSISIALPPRQMSDGSMGWVLSSFPEFLLTEEGHTVELSNAEQIANTGLLPTHVYLSVACYSFRYDEVAAGLASAATFRGEPFRPECLPLLKLIDFDRPHPGARDLDVPWRDWEFHAIPAAHPLVGLFPAKATS
jgi:hypothetical protein